MGVCLLMVVSSEQESDSKEEDSFKTEALQTLGQLTKALDQWETQQLLGGQYDKLGAILSIQVEPVVSTLPHICGFSPEILCAAACSTLAVSTPSCCYACCRCLRLFCAPFLQQNIHHEFFLHPGPQSWSQVQNVQIVPHIRSYQDISASESGIISSQDMLVLHGIHVGNPSYIYGVQFQLLHLRLLA